MNTCPIKRNSSHTTNICVKEVTETRFPQLLKKVNSELWSFFQPLFIIRICFRTAQFKGNLSMTVMVACHIFFKLEYNSHLVLVALIRTKLRARYKLVVILISILFQYHNRFMIIVWASWRMAKQNLGVPMSVLQRATEFGIWRKFDSRRA